MYKLLILAVVLLSYITAPSYALFSRNRDFVKVGDSCAVERKGFECPDFSTCSPSEGKCVDLLNWNDREATTSSPYGPCFADLKQVSILTIHSITCIKPKDGFWSGYQDEVYLVAKGFRKHAFPSSSSGAAASSEYISLKKGDVEALDVQIPFSKQAFVEIYENDYLNDSVLGSFSASENDKNKSIQTALIKHGEDWEYIVKYSVTAQSLK